MFNVWTPEEEAKRLHSRFDALKAQGVGQAEFARLHGIPGGASMVNQHIKGRRPMSLEAATAYARGFQCSIAHISPRLAQEVQAAIGAQSVRQVRAASNIALAPAAPWSLADALAQLGKAIAASDDLTRAQIKPIFDQLLSAPEQAGALGRRLQATLDLAQVPLSTG